MDDFDRTGRGSVEKKGLCSQFSHARQDSEEDFEDSMMILTLEPTQGEVGANHHQLPDDETWMPRRFCYSVIAMLRDDRHRVPIRHHVVRQLLLRLCKSQAGPS